MRRLNRSMVIPAVAALVAAASIATPAQAAACTVKHSKSSTSDAAWIMDVSGACNWVSVRHKYDPVWSTNNYWTSWYGGSEGYVAYYTPHTPVYFRHGVEFY